MSYNDLVSDFFARLQEKMRARQGDATDEAVGYADLWPVVLFLDPARIGPDATEVPASIMARYKARPIRKPLWMSPEDDQLVPFMDPWQRQQFAASGYSLTVLAFLPLQELQPGRRALTAVEVALRDALRLWIFTLLPAIEALFNRSAGLRERYLSHYDCIAHNAPSLVALAQESLARGAADATGTGDAADREDQSVLRVFLTMQADEGRKQRLLIDEGEAVRDDHGVALQQRYVDNAKSRLGPGDGVQEIATLLLRYIELLDLLAKGRRVATAILSARPQETRDYVRDLDRLDGKGAHGIRHAPDGHGKRPRAAADRINAAQKPEAYVQPPVAAAEIRFTPQELAGLAFLCDIDCFQISLQHQLLCPEIWAARALGAKSFHRRSVDPAAVEPLRKWLEITHLPPEPGLDAIETSCRDIATTVAGLQELLLWMPIRIAREHSG